MLGPMWVFPLLAAVVAFAFAAVARPGSSSTRRRPYQLVWVLALAMYGLASLAVVAGRGRGLVRA